MKRFNVLQIVIISIFVMITINLNAQKTAIVLQTGRTNTYTVFSIPYNPPFPFTGGTPVSVNTDDVYSGVITLPFNFCFYGQEYNQVIVGSNGVISFDLTNAGGYCPWSFSDFVPSNALPLNSIFGAYSDIDPGTCGNLYYDITGTSPNRKFVFKCNQVCYFSCSSLQTSQEIVLYEGSNVIEVYIEDHPACTGWNSGNAIIGIQDATGTTGVAAPDRNTGPWTAYNEAWRFTGSPDACNSQTCQFDSITIQNQTCGTDNEFTLYNADLCDSGYIPASTFKIPNSANGGSWENWDPRMEIKNVSDSDAKTGKTRALVRMVKKWSETIIFLIIFWIIILLIFGIFIFNFLFFIFVFFLCHVYTSHSCCIKS